MRTQDDEFLKLLRATFKLEAAEHLQVITAGLLELEKAPAPGAQREIVETVFRAAHSLKGAARAVDFIEIESLCQSLEDVFATWKRQGSAPSSTALDTLHRTLDAITAAMSEPKAARGAPAARSSFDQPVQRREVSVPALSEVVPPAPLTHEKTFPAEETVRISVARLNARLVDAEEMLAVKLNFGQRVGDLGELAQRLESWRGVWAAVEPAARAAPANWSAGAQWRRPPVRLGIDPAAGLFDWNHEQLKSVEGKVAALTRTAEQELYSVGKQVDDLLEDSKKLLLLPFDTISASFAKLVRDLCRDQGKEAELRIYGEHIEIDKRILEEMKDPLIHLLRNSIDHGIETAAERTRRGKPQRAMIKLAVSQISGNKVQLIVSDDGAGIDAGKVKASAVKRGLISAEEAARLSESESQALIFRSDVSTSPIITQLSGRGLGLAIVQEKANKLGGGVSVDSQQGVGCVFRIELPATRATFRGILVKAAGRLLVVPTAQVERVTRARPDDVKTVEGRETISFDGRAVALVWLADILELPPVERKDMASSGVPVIILGGNGQRVAFAVDEVLDEQEILVKPLAKPLSRVRNVAAATVLGSGQVAPILNVADLLKSARKLAGAPARVAAAAAPAQAEARTILVAEDSITSRLLLRGILESAGYNVKIAVDGMEAFTLLRAESFDLVVSDVEMPRLNGFDLTARIRADEKLAELPVVLVTALETREDRERGIDAGANAYIVKSSFDQSNLIEAVRRLI
ncbi:response regulator [Polaromonas sp. P1(28)-13]|nr:response regulator [Polaromonas sp. P1(28)-13]